MQLHNRVSIHLPVTVVVPVLGVIFAWCVAVVSAEPPPLGQVPRVLIQDDPSLQMRAKLDRSKTILEAVIQQDFDSVSCVARELKRIAGATDWPMEGDTKFERYRAQFEMQCDDLDRLAKGSNSNGIQITFLAMTETCIRCHDHVRDAKSAAQKARTGEVRLFPARSAAGTFSH